MQKKSAKIETQNAKLNISQNSNIKAGKKYSQKAKNTIKKANILVCFLLLILSLGLGVGAYFIVSKNDCFTLLGEQEYTVDMQMSEDETSIYGTFTDLVS